MIQYDFEESIGYWLTKAHHAYVRAFQRALAPHGVTFRQAQVMGWLVAEGPQSQRELADRMLIDPPNLVGVLDRMEEAGLVERQKCPEDARKNRIHLLPAAEEQWNVIAACGRSIRTKAAECMSSREQQQLKRLLRVLGENLPVDDPVETP